MFLLIYKCFILGYDFYYVFFERLLFFNFELKCDYIIYHLSSSLSSLPGNIYITEYANTTCWIHLTSFVCVWSQTWPLGIEYPLYRVFSGEGYSFYYLFVWVLCLGLSLYEFSPSVLACLLTSLQEETDVFNVQVH